MPSTAARSGSSGPVPADQLIQRGILDELGDDPRPVAVVDHVDDSGQARMVDGGHGPGFPAHTGGQGPALHVVERVGEPQFLDGDEPLGDEVLGSPEDSHAPLFEWLEEAVAVVHHAAGGDNAWHVGRAYPVRPDGGCQ